MIGRRPKKPRQPKAPPKSLLNYLSSERVGLRGRKKATQKPVAKPKAVTVTGKKPPAPKRTRTHGDPVAKRRVPKKDITKAVDYDRRGPKIDFPKGKPVAQIDYFKDGKRIVNTIQPDRRTPKPKGPTRDGVKTDAGITRPYRRRPPTTPTPKKPSRPRTTPRPKRPIPKNLQAFIEELKKKQKGKIRPPRPPQDPKLIIPETFKGYKKISAMEAGFKGPPRGSLVTQAFQTFHNPTTGQMVTVSTGGYTAPKGWIRGRPKDEFFRKPPTTPRPIRPGLTDPSGKPIPQRPTPRPPTTLRPPSTGRPIPANSVEKLLAGRKPEELNRQEKIRFQKEIYKLDQERNKPDFSQVIQNINNRFRNDPARRQFELAKLNRSIRLNDAVQKFRAGMISSTALQQLGLPQRDLRNLVHQKRIFLMPESPRKYEINLNFQMREMNLDLRNQLREMQRQGVSRQEILRRQVAHSNQIARMKQNLEELLFRKFGKKPTTGKAPFPVRPRVQPRRLPKGFASLFGPR